MFSMTIIGRFLRGFSVVDIPAVAFDFKDSTANITVPVYVLVSLRKQCISMV